MIRRATFVLLVILIVVSPLGLAAQSADSRQMLETVSGESSAAGGCYTTGVPDEQGGHGFDLANLDRSVSPCDDFFQFADGGWVKSHPIPAAYPSWGTFNKLHEDNENALQKILDKAAADKSAAPGSNWQKIGDFYASCMDESAIETAGIQPLQPELQRIASINDAKALQAEIASLHRQGVRAVFGFSSQQDFKNSTQEIAGARQGGLGMPDRDYYIKDDEKSVTLRAAYVQHVTNMFKLAGDDDAKAAAEAKTVMDIETSLAKASMTRVETRDPDHVYHKMTLAQLKELTPNFAWPEFFAEVGAPPVEDMNVGQPDFFKVMNASLTTVPLADWKVYLRWHLIHTAAPGLSSKFVDENFDFYGKTLVGTKEQLPRWRRCVQATDATLGEALGQYYVKENFPPEAKAKAIIMVKNLMAALRDDLATLDWMSPETRKQAAVKLDAITIKIGYPDKWRDYSAFKVDRGPYASNVIRSGQFEVARELAKIGKPVDRTEWGMTPPTVNAYYNPSMNEIVFPAGILQPPFYDANRDDAMNYGGIGVVIGHEMTHGFDDQGAKFDAQGNLKNWWTPEDLANFKARGDCIAKQFSEFEVEPGLHENGQLVEGESIADLGGLTISYAAMQKSFNGKEPEKIDGFTAEQRYFIAFAQIWAGSNRPEFARLMVATNPHPLGPYRTKGPVSNMPAFAKAWGCKADSPMVRAEALRCRIW
ncbi:MAG TPA: M13 family metallopeptidase [Candidatus Acidoferrales bacterium]|nr:M13 family metallopeptidase [Candidatus Acidoferrales bacterium]